MREGQILEVQSEAGTLVVSIVMSVVCLCSFDSVPPFGLE